MEDRLIELEALQKALMEGTGLFVSTNLGAEDSEIFHVYQQYSLVGSFFLLQKPTIKCKVTL